MAAVKMVNGRIRIIIIQVIAAMTPVISGIDRTAVSRLVIAVIIVVIIFLFRV